MLIPNQNRNNHGALLYILIILFVLLDMSVLILNLWVTQKVETDSRIINLSGRQRMLSQKITKALLHHQLYRTTESLDELSLAHHRFSETLEAFRRGGTVTHTNGFRISLEAIKNPKVQSTLHRTFITYTPLRKSIDLLLVENTPKNIDIALNFSLDLNTEILNLMNILTGHIEEDSYIYTQKLRFYQSIAFLLSLLNFIGIISYLHYRYQTSESFLNNISRIVENIQSGLIVADQNNLIVMHNKSAANLFDSEHRDINGKSIDYFIKETDDGHTCITINNKTFSTECIFGEVNIEGNNYTIISITDISEQIALQSQLKKMALHDSLTGLPNRRLLIDRIEQEINRRHTNTYGFALFFLDLDGFKQINDTLGHKAGDELLLQVTHRISKTVRISDTLCRLGGDEFVLLANNINTHKTIVYIADEILDVFKLPFLLNDKHFQLSSSIGISRYPNDANKSENLIDMADAAMYKAKRSGKNCYIFYRSTEYSDENTDH